MNSENESGGIQIERSTCSFCEMESEYLLSVSDPAPPEIQLLEGDAPMPICIDHWRDLKDELKS